MNRMFHVVYFVALRSLYRKIIVFRNKFTYSTLQLVILCIKIFVIFVAHVDQRERERARFMAIYFVYLSAGSITLNKMNTSLVLLA